MSKIPVSAQNKPAKLTARQQALLPPPLVPITPQILTGSAATAPRLNLEDFQLFESPGTDSENFEKIDDFDVDEHEMEEWRMNCAQAELDGLPQPEHPAIKRAALKAISSIG